MMRRIEITIDEHGVVSFTIRGVKGQGCADIANKLKAALAGEVLEEKHTSEYYERPQAVGKRVGQ